MHTTRSAAPLLTLLAAALLAACASVAPDAGTLIAQAGNALHDGGAKAVVISGRGTGSTFGQAWQPAIAWPALNYSQLKRSYNLETGAFGEEFGRSRAEPNGGGAMPLLGQGEQRATGFARDGFAWAAGANNTSAPTPVALPARVNDLWTTSPHAALAAARRYGATAGTRTVDGKSFNTLSFAAPGALRATLFIDERSLVTRVDSTMPHPVLGDTAVSTEFLDYAPAAAGGKPLPKRIRQRQGGFEVLDLQVGSYSTTEAVDITVPDSVKAARETVAVQQAAPGVWYLAGGTHHSVAIELAEQIVLVEAPLYDGRTLAAIEAANKLVPGKVVKTVINSHHHFDHAGGLRAAAGSGAQLITSSLAKPYFDRVFANPNSIAPDHLAKAGGSARIVAAGEKTVLRDSLRNIEIHEMTGSVHAQGFLLVWLPAEKLVIQADAYTPSAPGTPPPAVPNANNVNLVANLERLALVPERILPLHGRIVPLAELHTAIGRK